MLAAPWSVALSKERSTTERSYLVCCKGYGAVCSEVWFQESCLGLGEIYLFIILINDIFPTLFVGD